MNWKPIYVGAIVKYSPEMMNSDATYFVRSVETKYVADALLVLLLANS